MNVRHTIKKNMIKKPIGNTIPRIRPSPKIAIMVIAMKKMKKMKYYQVSRKMKYYQDL